MTFLNPKSRILAGNMVWFILGCCLLLVQTGKAELKFTNKEFNIYNNIPFRITWQGAPSDIDMVLYFAPVPDISESERVVIEHGTFGAAGTYTWTPSGFETDTSGKLGLAIIQQWDGRPYVETKVIEVKAHPPSSSIKSPGATITATTTVFPTVSLPVSQEPAMSPEMKAIIGVGTGLGGLLILGALAAYILCTRQRKTKEASPRGERPAINSDPIPTADSDHKHENVAELVGRQRNAELCNISNLQSLDATGEQEGFGHTHEVISWELDGSHSYNLSMVNQASQERIDTSSSPQQPKAVSPTGGGAVAGGSDQMSPFSYKAPTILDHAYVGTAHQGHHPLQQGDSVVRP